MQQIFVQSNGWNVCSFSPVTLKAPLQVVTPPPTSRLRTPAQFCRLEPKASDPKSSVSHRLVTLWTWVGNVDFTGTPGLNQTENSFLCSVSLNRFRHNHLLFHRIVLSDFLWMNWLLKVLPQERGSWFSLLVPASSFATGSQWCHYLEAERSVPRAVFK